MLEPFVLADTKLPEDFSFVDDVSDWVLTLRNFLRWREKEGSALIRLVLKVLQA